MGQVAIFNLSLDYPEGVRTEVKPKSSNEKGKLALIRGKQTENGQNVILLQWEHRDSRKGADLESKIERDYKFLNRRRDVDEISILESRNLSICNHPAKFRLSSVKRNMSFLFMKRIVDLQLVSVHLYCDRSERYITFYWSSPVRDQSMADLVSQVALSLRCH